MAEEAEVAPFVFVSLVSKMSAISYFHNEHAANNMPFIDIRDPRAEFLQQFVMAGPTTNDISFPIKQKGPICYLFSAALCIYYSHLRPQIDAIKLNILNNNVPDINPVLRAHAGNEMFLELLVNLKDNTLDACNLLYHFIHSHFVEFNMMPEWIQKLYPIFLEEHYEGEDVEKDGKNGGYVEVAIFTLINACGIPCEIGNLLVVDYNELESYYNNYNDVIPFSINPEQPIVIQLLSEHQTREKNEITHPIGTPKFETNQNEIFKTAVLLLQNVIAICDIIRQYYVEYNEYKMSNGALSFKYHSKSTNQLKSHCVFLSYTLSDIYVIDGNIGKAMSLRTYIHYMRREMCNDMFIVGITAISIPIAYDQDVINFMDGNTTGQYDDTLDQDVIDFIDGNTTGQFDIADTLMMFADDPDWLS